MRGSPVCALHAGKGGGPKGERNGTYRTGHYTAEAPCGGAAALLRIFASEHPLCFLSCDFNPPSNTGAAGKFGSEPLYRGPSHSHYERTAICKAVLHALTNLADVVLRATFKAGVQARHYDIQRPNFVPVSPLPLADAGRVEMLLGSTSCQRDQHTLDIRALLQGLRGECHAATVVVRLDPNLLQPQSEGKGNSRVAGLMMRKEVELARSSFDHGSPPLCSED